MVMYDIMARDQICENSNLCSFVAYDCSGLVFGGEACNNLKGQMKQAPVDATSAD